MLPAQYGDSIAVTYGDHAILIDGGVASTYDHIVERVGAGRRLELFCVTHIDEDHIHGAVKLLAHLPRSLEIAEVWFNGYDHLSPKTRLGAKQGEELGAAIQEIAKLPWNVTFNGEAAVVPDEGELPVFLLPGGLRLTMLSPYQKQLDRLKPVWEKECRKAGIQPGDVEDGVAALERDRRLRLGDHVDVAGLAAEAYSPDGAEANGSSISFLAEYEGKAVLFGADAYSEVLLASIQRLLRKRDHRKLKLDACKVPHHGSKFNNSPELIAALDCPKWLFSTNGKKFHHPDGQTIARILASRGGRQSELYFNYRSPENEVWDNTDLCEEWSYQARYPKLGREGLVVAV